MMGLWRKEIEIDGFEDSSIFFDIYEENGCEQIYQMLNQVGISDDS